MKTQKTHNQTLQLLLTIDPGPEVAGDELDLQTRDLRLDLLELGADSAELVHDGPTPKGAKSGEAVTLGSLALSVLPAFLPTLLEYLVSWSRRGDNRRVKIKAQVGDRVVELDYLPGSLSPEELARLVETLTSALDKQDPG